MQNDYSPLIGNESLQYINKDINPVKRIVVTAANKLGDTGILLVGARHWDSVMRAQWKVLKNTVEVEQKDIEQGFIDQYGQFLSRKEAFIVANENGQKLIGENWHNELFSENLH